MSVANIVQCFIGVDMRNGHKGLSQLARKNHINVENLPLGEYVVFINATKNRIKIYAANQTIAYHWSKEKKITIQSIPLILKAFQSAARVNPQSALTTAVERILLEKEPAKSLQVFNPFKQKSIDHHTGKVA